MKKFAALCIVTAILFSGLALAFEGQGYPEWDGASVPDDSLCAVIDGVGLRLEFDPTPDYSNVEDGSLQACFYAYDASREHYMEVYLLLTEDALSGDSFHSGDGRGVSIALFETALDSETFFYADDAGADATSYTLNVESAQRDARSISMRGSFSAVLRGYDPQDRPLRAQATLEDAHFSFTLPLSGEIFRSTPQPSDEIEPQVTFPALPGNPEETFPALPQPDEPEQTFPALPQPNEPEETFPANPQPGAPEETFPAPSEAPLPTVPAQPQVGDKPAFTLPPDYAEI